MRIAGRYGTRLQTLLLDVTSKLSDACPALKDECIGGALAAADSSGEHVGSGKLVSAWRTGERATMTLGALDVVLGYVRREAGAGAALRMIDVLAREYGGRVVELAAAAPSSGTLQTSAMALMTSLGETTHAIHSAVLDGTVCDEDRARVLKELDEHIAECVAMREQLQQAAKLKVLA